MERLILYSFRAASSSIQRILNGTSHSSFNFADAEITETEGKPEQWKREGKLYKIG
jgi:hypothetical protein